MPNKPKTPHHVIRVDSELWDDFGQVCASEDTNRSEDLRAYMRRKVRQWKNTAGHDQDSGSPGGQQST